MAPDVAPTIKYFQTPAPNIQNCLGSGGITLRPAHLAGYNTTTAIDNNKTHIKFFENLEARTCDLSC